jgi:hypothetical protein
MASESSAEDSTRTPLENTGKTGLPPQSGAESGAVADRFGPIDPGLQAVVASWPTLPEQARQEILAIIAAAGQRAEG